MPKAALVGCLMLAGPMYAGCGSTNDGISRQAEPSQESSMTDGLTDGYGRGPLEDAIARMKRMRTEMIDALDHELGRQRWAPAANQDGADIAGCNDGVSQTVGLRTYTFSATYPAQQWHRAAAIVERIGRKYGFGAVNRTVDKPGNLDMTGAAPDGGSYNFAMAQATILSVSTGCYQWAHQPGPGAWLTIDPTPGQQ